MNKKNRIVFLFPGQGSQYVGMGKELFDQFSEVRDLFDQASTTLNLDLKNLCFEGPESTLIQTENVQPAVTLINIACFHVLKKSGVQPAGAAGHSLGEYAALHAAGCLSFIDAMRLVHFRGKFMQEAAEKNPGTMVAVLGLDAGKLQLVCEKAGHAGSVEVANFNSPKQVILTGDPKGMELASKLAKEEGAKRVIPLKVSGPWHSGFMTEAQKKMEEVIGNISIQKPSIPVIANISADYETESTQIRNNLIRQITGPVRWTESMERFIRDGFRSYVEVGPGKVLSRLMKDIHKEIKTYNVENPETMEQFLQTR